MNTSTVIERFLTRQVNRRYGAVNWRNSTNSVYCDGDVLYSYGTHFPMAKRVIKMSSWSTVTRTAIPRRVTKVHYCAYWALFKAPSM